MQTNQILVLINPFILLQAPFKKSVESSGKTLLFFTFSTCMSSHYVRYALIHVDLYLFIYFSGSILDLPDLLTCLCDVVTCEFVLIEQSNICASY